MIHLIPFIIKLQLTFVSVSYYYPAANQCQGDYTITADGSKIDTVALRAGKLKWCALSRDMLSRWGGQYNYGDSINLHGLGWYEVHDCMNARFKQKVDILSYTRIGITKTYIIETK